MDLKTLGRELRSFSFWKPWLTILLGCTVMAAGFVYFMNPYNITPGGVYGMGIVLHYLFPSIQVGWFGYMMDIPLLLIGFRVFGRVFGAKTVFAAMYTPAAMLVLTYLSYPDVALQTPQTLLGGHLDLSENLFLASIFGAVLIGAGVGLVVRMQATTGGTDIVAMLLNKYMHVKFANGVMMADSFVVMCNIVVLVGFGGADPTLPLYSLISIYISAKVLDWVIDVRSNDKLLFIISEKHEALRRFILEEMERGATYVKSQGMYTRNEKDMIFLVVSRREILTVRDRIMKIDPQAFVVIVDAGETYGEGFKAFPEKMN